MKKLVSIILSMWLLNGCSNLADHTITKEKLVGNWYCVTNSEQSQSKSENHFSFKEDGKW